MWVSYFISIVVDLGMDIIHTSDIMALLCCVFACVVRIGVGCSLWARPWENPHPLVRLLYKYLLVPSWVHGYD